MTETYPDVTSLYLRIPGRTPRVYAHGPWYNGPWYNIQWWKDYLPMKNLKVISTV